MSFLLKIWNLVPVWSSGMVPHCQECICSYGPDRKSDASILPPMWTQEGGLPAFTYLGQICKACFACQSLCLLELFFFLLCPNSFLSKQSERNKSLKQFFFFFFFFLRRTAFVLQEFHFGIKCWGKLLRWIKARQLSLLFHVCCLKISYFIA